jgi:hypothetical protein
VRIMNARKTKESYQINWDSLDQRTQIVQGDLNPDFKYWY